MVAGTSNPFLWHNLCGTACSRACCERSLELPLSVLAGGGRWPVDPVERGEGKTTTGGRVGGDDVSSTVGCRLANTGTRGSSGTGADVLISGFIVGDVASAAVVVRALGPSLPPVNVDQPLNDPKLTIFDANGSMIAENDNWQDDNSADDIAQLGLAPTKAAESATALLLPAGSYSAIVAGVAGETGVGLVEVYHLD